MLDFEQFTPVPELFDDSVVAIVLMNDKVAIVPLEIVSKHVDLSCVIECQGIQPFQEISDAMVARETHGLVIVFGFGHDEIGDVLFLGVAWLQYQKTRAKGAGRPPPPPPGRFQAPWLLLLVWREGLLAVSSFSSSCLEVWGLFE